jgi:hypothetical protein
LSSDLWRHAGAGARAALFSFNGNKIITTSGGGMLASDDGELIKHAKKLSQQAREDFPHYEHVEIGYNYRMSNVLAAIGRGEAEGSRCADARLIGCLGLLGSLGLLVLLDGSVYWVCCV